MHNWSPNFIMSGTFFYHHEWDIDLDRMRPTSLPFRKSSIFKQLEDPVVLIRVIHFCSGRLRFHFNQTNLSRPSVYCRDEIRAVHCLNLTAQMGTTLMLSEGPWVDFQGRCRESSSSPIHLTTKTSMQRLFVMPSHMMWSLCMCGSHPM